MTKNPKTLQFLKLTFFFMASNQRNMMITTEES